MKRMPLAILALAAAALPSLAQAGEGPSFDCAKAKAPSEKMICSDPKLAALDRAVADTYRADLARISEEGRAELLRDQRDWLASVRTCSQERDPLYDAAKSCFTTNYEDRLRHLKAAVQVTGGLTFRGVVISRGGKVKDADGDAGTWSVDVFYPVIDQPKTPAERAFNAHMKSMAETRSDIGDDSAVVSQFLYDDIVATPRLISVDATSGADEGGTHGLYDTEMLHWLLPEQRELKADDVFKKGTPWKAVLQKRCFAAVAHFGFVEKAADLEVSDPAGWRFDAKGLTVIFGHYAVASYADGEQEVTIPWKVLKPFLVPGAPVPVQ
jgi:uncharacterized protein